MRRKEKVIEEAEDLPYYVSPISILSPDEKVEDKAIKIDACDKCGLSWLLNNNNIHTEERCDENQQSFYYKASLKFDTELLNMPQIKKEMQKAIEEDMLISYSCGHCGENESSRANINSHLKKSTCMCGYIGICKSQTTHDCNTCEEKIEDEEPLRERRKEDHPEPKCSQCKLILPTYESLCQHIEELHNHPEDDYGDDEGADEKEIFQSNDNIDKATDDNIDINNDNNEDKDNYDTDFEESDTESNELNSDSDGQMKEEEDKCECCGHEFLSKPHLKRHKEIITEKAQNLNTYVSPIFIQNPDEKVGYEDITFYSCEDCGLTLLLDNAHTEERCDNSNQHPFYNKISSEFNADVLNIPQNKIAIQNAIEEERAIYYACDHCGNEVGSRKETNSHLNENTCMCGYIGICKESSTRDQTHSQMHEEFEKNRTKEKKNKLPDHS